MLLLEAPPSPPLNISPADGSQSLQAIPSQLPVVTFSKNSTPLNPAPQCSVFSLFVSVVQLFVTPQTAARQASLSFTNSQSLLTLTFIESAMPSNHLVLRRPLLPPCLSSIRVFTCVPVATPGTASHPFSPSHFLRLDSAQTLWAPFPRLWLNHPLLLLLLPLPSLQAPGLCPLVITSSRRKPMAPDVHRSPAPSFPNPRTQNPASSPLPAAWQASHLHGAEKQLSQPAPHPALTGLLSWLLGRHPPVAQTPE